MLITEMSDRAKGHVLSLPNATPKVMAEKLRRHLWTLTCQADIVELTGELDDFGGDRDVGTNIGKSIVALFCLGHLLGMNPATAIDTIVSEMKGYPHPPQGQASDADAGDSSPAAAAAAVETERKETAKSGSSPDACTPSKEPAAGEKAGIETYRAAFMTAGDKFSIEKTWKAVSEDKGLSGQEKFQLQTDKKEALKRLSA